MMENRKKEKFLLFQLRSFILTTKKKQYMKISLFIEMSRFILKKITDWFNLKFND